MDSYIVYYLIGLFHLINTTHQQFVNVAYGKSATISSRYNGNYFAPGKAVDGDTSTYLLDCSLSASGQKEAWLQVDLGEKKNIASISFIHGGLGRDAKALTPQYSGISADSDGTGTVYQSDGKALCLEKFRLINARVICLIWGFLPDRVNVGGTSSDDISSRYIKCQGNETSINQCPSETCTRDRAATVTCQKGSTLAGFSVYVSDTQNWTTGSICYQHDIQEIPNTNDININCVTSGRYVTIYNARNQTSYTGVSYNAYINICEIDVQGCETGFYGTNCTKCPENCLSSSCHFQIGYCFHCEDGYTGEMCESECASGFYGQSCSLTCADCRDDAACNNVNGSCPDGCSTGRRGDKCDLDCEYGYFGYTCNNRCYLPNCRNRTSCNTISGECLVGCVEGWAGKTCNVCAETYYGPGCNLTCSSYCLDSVCNLTNVHCIECPEYREGTFCESVKDTTTITLVCAETYHGQSCNLSCSAYCKDSLCNPVTGFCDACIEKRSGDFCENEISVNNPAADCEYGYSRYSCNKTCYLTNCRNNTSFDNNTEECLFGCDVGWADKKCIATSTNTNSLLIAVVVVSAILILTMVSIAMYCIKRNYRCVQRNNREPEYENTVITDENNEYNQLQLKKENDSAESETAHYMDISTIDGVSNTEYANLSFK